MPSFAFWKSSKPDESRSPLLSDADIKEELSVIIPGVTKAVDLNPGNQDAGVFLFDEDAQEIPGDQTPVAEPTSTFTEPAEPTPLQPSSATKVETSLLDAHEPSPHPQTPAISPEEPLAHDRIEAREDAAPGETDSPSVNEEVAPQVELPSPESQLREEPSPAIKLSQVEEDQSASQSRPVSLVPKECGPTIAVEKRATDAALGESETNLRDRDSGVYLSENESSPAQSRPVSVASIESPPAQSRPVSIASIESPPAQSRPVSVVSNENSPLRSRVTSLSKPSAPSPQRTKSITRLQRPAELNLGFGSAPDPAKPKSELDMRYDLIRNSKTQSKAALRSPTQLLQDRLNMSPRKKNAEEKVRVFTPPRATVNGCLLPGPGAQAEAFTSTSVRAITEAGRPAWWCKFDKLVIFDGAEQAGGETKLTTRTSKGLTIARRRGDLETVVIPLDCAHCHEMLNRHEWKYDIRVCKRSVCWDCKERCKWELEQERMVTAATPRTEANRERADSMLQDEQYKGHELRKEIVA